MINVSHCSKTLAVLGFGVVCRAEAIVSWPERKQDSSVLKFMHKSRWSGSGGVKNNQQSLNSRLKRLSNPVPSYLYNQLDLRIMLNSGRNILWGVLTNHIPSMFRGVKTNGAEQAACCVKMSWRTWAVSHRQVKHLQVTSPFTK